MEQRTAEESAAPYSLPADQVLAYYQVTPDGLDMARARERLASMGPNSLPEPPRDGPLKRFAAQFRNILIYVLLGAALITTMLRQWLDTGVILAVVVANAVLGFIQEGKAEQAIAAIRGMLAPRASVLRDGVRQTLPAEQLVPGDIVLLEAGDRVPADLRLLDVHGLMTQEAVLTGESVPVEKDVEPVSASAPLGDRRCMAYSGTLISAGQGRGVVTATGKATEIGRISGMLGRVEPMVTPLVRQMDIFGRWLSLAILLVALLILAFGYFVQSHAFGELFIAVVGLTVAAIPEGLPAVLTITLAVGVKAMARRHAIVRHLPSIETVGAVSVICTDKTGTLTRNEMMVASVVTGPGRTFTVEGQGYAPDGRILRDHDGAETGDDSLTLLARTALLCNDARLHEHEGDWQVEGDPMEGALIALARKARMHDTDSTGKWHRTDVIPFDARHRLMATLDHDHEGHAGIFVKGAPEAIVGRCRWQLGADGKKVPLEPAFWQDTQQRIADQGQRVLALAFRQAPGDRTVLQFSDIDEDLVLAGLVGLIDPPRPEAITAIAECRSAGIQVKMVTGDHAGTAGAIARQVGLESPERVLTGRDLDGMSDRELAAAVAETSVFARTSPEHKLRLVTALQASGLAVAMTGDGVNDAPALKRADIGIAMGRKGSAATREAADLVLTDDNFASIVAAVREGRTVYDNLKKLIAYTLPTNIGEAMTILVALFLGLTLPVTPVQILWINLITGITLGIALAFEPVDDATMSRPPRKRDEPLLSGVLLWILTLTSALFLSAVYGVFSHALERGDSVEQARTLAVNTLVALEICYLFFIRNFHTTTLTPKTLMGTPVVWLSVTLVTGAQLAITFIPPLQQLFGTRAITAVDALLILGIGVALLVVLEGEKQIRLRWMTGFRRKS